MEKQREESDSIFSLNQKYEALHMIKDCFDESTDYLYEKIGNVITNKIRSSEKLTYKYEIIGRINYKDMREKIGEVSIKLYE